ncbi:MAG: PilZ domain-containing protein [Pelagimonas sp.]|uniref:PilZ domain-containing protein n=1 Tax=Pelagimonas sp. TaxID=2073170 RepID=UPI003D6A053D
MQHRSATSTSSQPVPSTDARQRHDVDIIGSVSNGRVSLDCFIKNMSAYGALLQFNGEDRPFAEEERVHIDLPGFGLCYANIKWAAPQTAGVKFRVGKSEKPLLRSIIDDYRRYK